MNTIKEIQRGNELAFRQVYDQYHHAVLLNINRLVQNQTIAEDILQDVFLTLWENRQKLNDRHTIQGWLFTTSYYKSLEHLKRAVKQKTSPLEDNMHETPDGDINLEEIYSEQMDIIHDAIEQLPPRKRAVYKLCRLEGKTFEEAAKMMDISVDSVKDYVKTATSFLKKYILEKRPTAPVLCICIIALHLQGQ